MIELTVEQIRNVSEGKEMPPRVLDPTSNTSYVLIRSEVFDRIKQLVNLDEDRFTDDMTPHVMEVFGRTGWDDPSMDIYNDLDPRVNQ